jgi:anthranilate synthase component 1
MNDYQKILNAQQGEMVTLYRVSDIVPDPVEYFAKISDHGRKQNCVLLESADIITKYGERSLGTADPCLKLSGKGTEFSIRALNSLGLKFLRELETDLHFCNELIIGKDTIRGFLNPVRKFVDESERLKLSTHIDIIRTVAFKFKPLSKSFIQYGGLFGAIAYDFIDQFEDLPANDADMIGDPDYELYYLDNLFLIDHSREKMYFIANALITDQDRDQTYVDCIKKMNSYEECLQQAFIPEEIKKPVCPKIVTDTSKTKYIDKVKKLKKHIVNGDIFQIVLSRTIIAENTLPPYEVYTKLRRLNPSPYMFFINNGTGTLLGASPEMFLKVEGDREKIVEIRPIAGTKPRGIIDGKIDPDLDSRYEIELKLDSKELAEHTMLIDLARNDIARISETGSRFVDEPFVIEKYSHVQHLVSNVTGILRKDLDALHAYLATMNMGTLTGAPKVEAMKLLRKYETDKRGYYGGAVGYLTPSGDFDSCILIRSIRFKNRRAYIKVGAGIVYDSDPEKEFEETEKKATACLHALAS